MLKTIKALWQGLPDGIKRAIHTFWQTFASVFILGLPAIFGASDVATARVALLALAASALASAFSAAKGALLTYLGK